MTPTKLLAVAAIGLSAAACSYSNTTTAPPPTAVAVPAGTVVVASTSQQACMDYGFTPGTASYDRCVRLEADARARGRVSMAYSQLTWPPMPHCCSSYCLSRGSMANRCVGPNSTPGSTPGGDRDDLFDGPAPVAGPRLLLVEPWHNLLHDLRRSRRPRGAGATTPPPRQASDESVSA